MKCLITGASGFLGKRILERLVKDPRIHEIHLISRSRRTHPDPKVIIHKGDLSLPLVGMDFFEDLDAVIHLAGLYEFNQPFNENYRHNVLSTLNLTQRLKQAKNTKLPQFFHASTYAVGYAHSQAIQEGPLKTIPSSNESYSYTKAIAEKILADSGLSARIFRLGILVGDSQHGEIEKIDGPYYLMRFLHRLSMSHASRFLPWLPIPLSLSGMTPLVPVDSAADVLHRALFLEPFPSGKLEFYGTYHAGSIAAETLCHWMFKNFLPQCRPKATSSLPAWLLQAQTQLTQIPKEVFSYSLRPVPLENPRFLEVFGKDAIPHFNDYEKPFINGFRECLRIKK